jgi:hypothetical protein
LKFILFPNKNRLSFIYFSFSFSNRSCELSFEGIETLINNKIINKKIFIRIFKIEITNNEERYRKRKRESFIVCVFNSMQFKKRLSLLHNKNDYWNYRQRQIIFQCLP